MNNKIIILFIALLITITGNAEWISDLFEYSSQHDYNGYYSYYEDEDENRIIHGTFQVNYKTDVVNGVKQYEIRGSFSHGKRDGKWIMKAILINGKYASNYLYQFNYTNGVLNGPFQIYSPETEEVEMFGQFANGVLTGKVTIKQHAWLGKGYIQIEGKVNSKGNPHGIWTEKEISEEAVPKDITELYYDGNLVYRKEKDLSSGTVEYTKKISDKIKTPADIVLITDTMINGKDYVNVAGTICYRDTLSGSDLYSVISHCRIKAFYPSVKGWHTSFDTEYYPNLVKKEQEEQQRRLEAEKKKKDEMLRRQREEKLRMEREAEAKLSAEIKTAWDNNRHYYEFCFGESEGRSKFEKLYREVGLDSINSMLDSICRFEYENYTVEELFTKSPNFRDDSLKLYGHKKKKKLNKFFKSYEEFVDCKKHRVYTILEKIR